MEDDPVIEELYMLGFERRWVNYAIKLHKMDGTKALEWLLSPEFDKAVQAERVARANQAEGRPQPGMSALQGEMQPSAPPPPPFNPEYTIQLEGVADGQASKPQVLHMDSHTDIIQKRRARSSRQKPSFVPQMNFEANSFNAKVRVGLPVLVFSQGAQDWLPGKIDKVQEDLVRIVYGESQKWLPQSSKVWRPIFEDNQREEKKVDALENFKPRSPPPINKPGKPYKRSKNDYEIVFKKGNPDFDVITDTSGMNAYVGKIRSKATKKKVKEGSQIMMVQQFSVDEVKCEEVLMVLARCSIGEPLRIIFRFTGKPVFEGLYPARDEQDYEVIFTESFLGLELMHMTKDGRNAIVKKRHSDLAKTAVTAKSWVVSIDHKWVYNHKYPVIKDCLKNSLKSAPTVMTFRAMIVDNQNERGLLIIRVVAALNLIQSANYAQIIVGETKLNTRSRSKSQNVEWQEKLAFKNFRPQIGKTATVRVCDSRTLMSDAIIGSCEFELPTRFSSMIRRTLELTTKKGKLVGIIVLHSIINPNPRWKS